MRRRIVALVGFLAACCVSCSSDDGGSPPASSTASAAVCSNAEGDTADLFDGLLPRSITLEGQTYQRPTVEVIGSERDTDGLLYMVGNIRDSSGAVILAGGNWVLFPDGLMAALNEVAFTHSAAVDGRTILTTPGKGADSPILQALQRCATAVPAD